MEAARDFIPFQDPDRAPVQGPVQGTDLAGPSGVENALALLERVGSTAVQDAALFGFRAASGFAGGVEELSRYVEYLQVVAAGAVDRTRKRVAADAAKAGTSWTTGWRDDSGSAAAVGVAAGGTVTGAVDGASPVTGDEVSECAASRPRPADPADDGYRNTVEFLRARLLIGASEARRRLALAEAVLPRRGFAGESLPPVRGELGAAVAAGEVASRAATVITLALDRVRHVCDADAAARMEHALTRTAAGNDADFLARVARRWADAMDQDGAEPSEELLRRLQGAFIRRRRHGLHHLEIFATTEQFEHLLTVMNTATNPRTGTSTVDASPAVDCADGSAARGEASMANPAGGVSACASRVATGAGAPAAVRASENDAVSQDHTSSESSPAGAESETSDSYDAAEDEPGAVSLDLRSRPQKLLDGLVGACKAALAAGSLPATGGLRPQVMVTIDYRDLLARLGASGTDAAGGPETARTAVGPAAAGRALEHTGTLLFTGPVTASTVRKIACDADIIPVVLGGEGRILDIGRASRIFPPHIRKALTARDQGCGLPRLHHPRTLVRSPPHHLLVPRRHLRHRKRGPALFPPPPRDPQRTLDHPGPHRDPLVHPATPHRPRQRPRRNNYFKPANLGTAV